MSICWKVLDSIKPRISLPKFLRFEEILNVSVDRGIILISTVANPGTPISADSELCTASLLCPHGCIDRRAPLPQAYSCTATNFSAYGSELISVCVVIFIRYEVSLK